MCSDIMCGDRLVVVGDDGAGQATGGPGGAALHDIRARQPIEAILLFGCPLIDEGAVRFAASGDCDIER